MTGISAVLRVGLELAEHLDAVDARHLDVQQQEDGLLAGVAAGVGALAADEVQGLLAVLEALQAVGQAGAFQVALDQAGVAVVVLGEHDQEGLGAHRLRSPRGSGWAGVGPAAAAGAARRRRAPLPGAAAGRRRTWCRRPAADSSQIRPPCRSTIRRTRASPMPSPWATSGVEAAEGGEHALVVGLGDAQAVVLDAVDLQARRLAGAVGLGASDLDSTRPGRVEVLHGVADQVGEDLLERRGVAPGRRQLAHGDLGPLGGDGVVQGRRRSCRRSPRGRPPATGTRPGRRGRAAAGRR